MGDKGDTYEMSRVRIGCINAELLLVSKKRIEDKIRCFLSVHASFVIQ